MENYLAQHINLVADETPEVSWTPLELWIRLSPFVNTRCVFVCVFLCVCFCVCVCVCVIAAITAFMERDLDTRCVIIVTSMVDVPQAVDAFWTLCRPQLWRSQEAFNNCSRQSPNCVLTGIYRLVPLSKIVRDLQVKRLTLLRLQADQVQNIKLLRWLLENDISML